MTDLVIPAPSLPSVPTTAGGAFPVRRIYCVGRNYAAHAREMGHDPDRQPPFFFGKPGDAVVTGDADVAYPGLTAQFEYEVEQVVAIGRGGADIDPAEALDHVWGYGVGLDLTRRDLQAAAKELSRPWDLAKGFDASAPVSTLVPASGIDPGHGAIELRLDGKTVQRGDLADMIWPVADVIAALSRAIRLEPGDLVFTGTPDGVGRVERGSVLEATLEGVGTLRTRIV